MKIGRPVPRIEKFHGTGLEGEIMDMLSLLF
ncbi:hypothetical protein CFAEC_12020 [Corynebacterium faecale]|nr:hypothetical protein CFAEC_12020 [Corynebacterium faecale]